MCSEEVIYIVYVSVCTLYYYVRQDLCVWVYENVILSFAGVHVRMYIKTCKQQ